jgi:hypothetical protein
LSVSILKVYLNDKGLNDFEKRMILANYWGGGHNGPDIG